LLVKSITSFWIFADDWEAFKLWAKLVPVFENDCSPLLLVQDTDVDGRLDKVLKLCLISSFGLLAPLSGANSYFFFKGAFFRVSLASLCKLSSIERLMRVAGPIGDSPLID
jgi:hypothetical protein